MTNKHTVTREIGGGNSVRVTVERGTWDEEKRLDGECVGTETHAVDRTEIELLRGGKVLVKDDRITRLSDLSAKQQKEAKKSGYAGMVGKAWLKPDTLEIVESAITEAEDAVQKTSEQIAIEDAESESEAEAKAWRNSPEGKARSEDAEHHERFVREMERENSDY